MMNTKKLMALGLAALMALVVIGPTIVQAKKIDAIAEKPEPIPEMKGQLNFVVPAKIYAGGKFDITVYQIDAKGQKKMLAEHALVSLCIDGKVVSSGTQGKSGSVTLTVPNSKSLNAIPAWITASLDGYVGYAVLISILPSKMNTLSLASSIR